MILSFKVKNYKAFSNEVNIDLIGDLRIKKFNSNIIKSNNLNILKVLGIYGPNNTGKTHLLTSIYDLIRIMKYDSNIHSLYNAFINKDDHISYFVIKYLINNEIYEYEVHYDSYLHTYNYERLVNIKINKNNSSLSKKTTLFIRDNDEIKINGLTSKKNKDSFSMFTNVYPLMKVIDFKSELLNKAKKDYIDFTNSISILKMGESLDISKTLNLLMNDKKAYNFLKAFIKNSDLNILDIGYSNEIYLNPSLKDEFNAYINDVNKNKDALKFYSVHNNIKVPSVLIDSLGTNKIIMMAGYIYEAIKEGKTLLVDELDSSLHHVLTRAIVSLFNNLLNTSSQLIFTSHDALLMDTKYLFRKDQIYLTSLDSNTNTPTIINFSKAFISRDQNGIRGDEDISSYYLKGRFGALPNVDLFQSLLEVTNKD